MNQDKKWKRVLQTSLIIVFLMVSGIILGMMNSKIAIRYTNIGGIKVFFAVTISLYISIFIQIIVHEAGHLFCGIITGYKFSSFRIGSFMIVKKKSGIEVKKFSLPGTGGQCLMAPPTGDDMPYILYNLGGVIFNIILGIICLAFYMNGGKSFYSDIFFFTAMYVGFIFAIINGVPLRGGMVNNDGCNILDIKNDKKALESFFNQMNINYMLTDGIRIKDMPEEWFKMPSIEDMKNSILTSSQGTFVVNRAMDEMNFEKAQSVGNSLLQADIKIAGIHKMMIKCEMIFCEIIGLNRKEVINNLYDKKLQKFLQTMSKYPSVLRMQYAYELLVNHNEAEANKKLEAFEKVSSTYPYKCEIDGERELIKYAYDRYEEILSKEESITVES